MRNEILIGLGVTILAASMIGVQSTYISRSGAVIGDTRSGMMTTVTGSVFAILVLVWLWRQGVGDWSWDGQTWLALIVAGVLGTFILTGISFASQRVGITTTLGTLLLGQMLVSSIVDDRGLAGGEGVPFTWVRLVGILLLFAGVYLTLNRQS